MNFQSILAYVMDSKETELFNRLKVLDEYQENEQQNIVVRNN